MVIAAAKYVLIAGILAGLGFGIYQLVSADEPEPAPVEPEETLPPLPTDEPDVEGWLKLAPEYGLELVGPPPEEW